MSLISGTAKAMLVFALFSSAHASMTSNWAASSLADLRRAAHKDDKLAQLELGRRYEAGVGINQDIKLAQKWYKRAARDTVNRHFVYLGPVGSERHGRALEIKAPRINAGLPEARSRLDILNNHADK